MTKALQWVYELTDCEKNSENLKMVNCKISDFNWIKARRMEISFSLFFIESFEIELSSEEKNSRWKIEFESLASDF